MTLIEKEDYEKAMRIATHAHEGQKRHSGEPYINHPLRVAKLVHSYELKTIALLHDVLEDTKVVSVELLSHGFSTVVVEAVQALTRREGEDYFQFIERCKRNDKARVVKLADIADNLRDLKPGSLRDKYLFAQARLMEYFEGARIYVSEDYPIQIDLMSGEHDYKFRIILAPRVSNDE